jgi:hypothetical protein
MNFEREKLVLPEGGKKLLLHSCCAPCSGEVMEAIIASDIDFTIFFHNPNIHPKKEYELRKEENIRFAEKHNIPFVDADYDVDDWFARAKGWNGNLREESDAPCVLICALNVPHYMPTKMDLISFPARWEFPDGKIWNKSTIPVYRQPAIMKELPTGRITGEKKAAQNECWK